MRVVHSVLPYRCGSALGAVHYLRAAGGSRTPNLLILSQTPLPNWATTAWWALSRLQRSGAHLIQVQINLRRVVPEGVEPPQHRFVACCTIHYATGPSVSPPTKRPPPARPDLRRKCADQDSNLEHTVLQTGFRPSGYSDACFLVFKSRRLTVADRSDTVNLCLAGGNRTHYPSIPNAPCNQYTSARGPTRIRYDRSSVSSTSG